VDNLKGKHQFNCNSQRWLVEIFSQAQCDKNRDATLALSNDFTVPLNYYAALTTLESMLPQNSYIVSEGANTMDIGRTIISNHLPRFTITFKGV